MFGYYDDDNRSEQLSESEWNREAFQQYAHVYGLLDVNQEWVLSPFDTWERNPHYTGTPGRHPEEDWDEEDEEQIFAKILNTTPGLDDEEDDDSYLYQVPYYDTNDCPF